MSSTRNASVKSNATSGFDGTALLKTPLLCNKPWASYQIHKIVGCACAGNARNVFLRRRLQRKPLISDPGMHHGTSVTHVPWWMYGSLTRGGGENVPAMPGARTGPASLRIWQEAHVVIPLPHAFMHWITDKHTYWLTLISWQFGDSVALRLSKNI